jgi:hypothetical protein
MKSRLIALAFLAASGLFAQTRFYAGATFGYRVPAPVAVYAAPPAPLTTYVAPCPGPGYTWVAGYWYPVGPRYSWHAGYWTRPAIAGGYWVRPNYARGRYYHGYWRR